MTCNPPLAPCQSRSRVFLRPGAHRRLETGVWGYCQLVSVLCSKCSTTNIPSIITSRIPIILISPGFWCLDWSPQTLWYEFVLLATTRVLIFTPGRNWVEVPLRTLCSFHLEARKAFVNVHCQLLFYVFVTRDFLLLSVDVECEVCDETQRSQTRLITATRNYICNNKSHNIIYE